MRADHEGRDGGPVHPQYVRNLLHRLGEKAGVDKRVHPRGFRHSYAVDLVHAGVPVTVISKLLGVPDGDEEQLRKWSDALLHRDEGDKDVTPTGVEAAYQLFKYFTAFVADKRMRPDGDDLAAALVAIEAEGEHLSEEQVVGFLFLLIIAGNETTTKLLGNCLLAMQRFPSERAKVIAAPERIPEAIEEILRFEGSTQAMARTLTRDVELHGRAMAAG